MMIMVQSLKRDMYEWSGSAWTQMGSSIVGSAAGDWFAVALDQDGDRVVIGAPNNDTQGSNAGEVKVYSGTDLPGPSLDQRFMDLRQAGVGTLLISMMLEIK